MILLDFDLSFFLELILEVLPISSSGHLKFLSYFTKSIHPLAALYVHLSHALMVCIQVFYVWPFFDILIYRKQWLSVFSLLINFIAMSIVTVLGYGIKHFLTKKVFFGFGCPLYIGFSITAFFLFFIYIVNKTRSKVYYRLSFKESILLGLWQCIAFVPGVSRFATMLLGAQLFKFTRRHSLFIAVFSNVAISVMSLLYLIYYYYCIENFCMLLTWVLLVKLLGSLLVSAFLFFIFIYFFNKNSIVAFVWYEVFISFIMYFIF